MRLARVLAVLVLLTMLFGLAAYSQMKISEGLSKFSITRTTITSTIDQLSHNLNTLRDISLKLPIAIALAAAPALVAKTLSSRKKLLGAIRVEDFQKHVLLFGPTGSGKTSTALRAIELSLRENVSVEVLDWKGEYASRIRGATIIRKMNLLEPPDWSNVENHTMVIVDILRDVLQLTEPMAYMLYEELSRMYESRKASFTTLMEQLKVRRAVALAQRYQAEAHIAEGLIRRILPLLLDEKRKAVNMKGDSRVVIHDFSELPTYQLKTLYAEIVLWRIFNEALKNRSGRLEKLVIAEESQNYVRPRRADMQPSIGERIVNELRAYGYGFILISPDPIQLPHHMTRDCGAVVSIGYQALPEIIMEFLNYYRYADARKLIKITEKPRTYVYCNGRLQIKNVPKPYKKTIDLGVESIAETVKEVEEKTGEELKIEKEKENLKILNVKESGEAEAGEEATGQPKIIKESLKTEEVEPRGGCNQDRPELCSGTKT